MDTVAAAMSRVLRPGDHFRAWPFPRFALAFPAAFGSAAGWLVAWGDDSPEATPRAFLGRPRPVFGRSAGGTAHAGQSTPSPPASARTARHAGPRRACSKSAIPR